TSPVAAVVRPAAPPAAATPEAAPATVDRTADLEPAPAAPGPPVAVESAEPPPAAPALPVYYGPLPFVEGFTFEEVSAFLGPAQTTQQSGATTVWYYSTPDGRLPVYFVDGLATFAPPARNGRGAAPPAVARRAPGRVGQCDGTGAVAG